MVMENATQAEDIVQPDYKLSLWEKLTFAVGDAGSNFSWTFIASFITIYLTDTVGIGAAVIGNIILIARLFDGFTDLFMGTVIDNTNTKMGKAKPWVFWTAPFLGIFTFFLFNVPDGLSSGQQIAFISVFYFLLSAVFYTANNVAYSSLTTFMTVDPEERVSLGSLRFVFAISAVLTITSFTMPLVNAFGGGQQGWTRTAILYGVLGTIFLMFTGYFVKERNVATKKDENRIPFKRVFSALLTSKYFYLVFGVYLLMYMRQTSSAAGVYYATYILGNENLLGLMSAAQMLPLVLGLLFASKIVALLGGLKSSIRIGMAIGTFGYLIMMINPDSLPFVLIGQTIASLGAVPLTGGASALVADMADYIYWKSNIPVQGAGFSTTSAGMKIGQGVASAMVGWMLALGNYIPNEAVQPESSIQSMKTLYIYYPLIVGILIIILISFMDLEDIMPRVREALKKENKPVAGDLEDNEE